ncbi:uncharacterized protein LOC115218571 [Octopus sinensis]|uniref:Uncharacterized protein LOC115218571 n=1 Tax=Octopus sinensis TaxID=2607531 RepID=A0A6P7T315_9MOLL|nr:uncharacterized protein LOC115218571 [Octopus sinensis]
MCLPGINTYYCLELDRDCGLPLQMNSAVIAWGNNWFVRYKCLVNMIGEDARKSKCQHSSVWSKPEACRYSCKLPYIVSFNMTNSTYSESSWKYECLETNTSCRMKTIWNNGSNHYLDISCTTKNNVSSQLTNFSYFCAKSKIVDNFNYFQPCLPKKARHPCQGVMKMVCEVFDRFSLEANKRKLAARLLDFQVGVWEQASTEEIERSDTEEESQRSDTEEVTQRSDTEEESQRSDTEEVTQRSDTEEESQRSGTEELYQK